MTWRDAPSEQDTDGTIPQDEDQKARDLVANVKWTKPMRRALLRKIWIPRKSGGETLLAQRLAEIGLFVKANADDFLVSAREYERTPLALKVLRLLDAKDGA